MLSRLNRQLSYFLKSHKRALHWGIAAIVIILAVFVLSRIVNFVRVNKLSPGFVTNLILSDKLELKKTDGKTNFLLLGIPGGDHEGIDLTDTIIFVSLDTVSKKVVLVSLPRDIWLESLKDKINTAYHYGETKKAGGGFILAKSAVSEIVGEPIHYVFLVDFAGFEKLVDLVGGVDITVDESFTDEKFPLPGYENTDCNGDPEYKCRYETVNFTKGLTHMDGQTSLKFVRSRYAQGDQGTDFARSERQKKLLLALKDKLITFTNLSPEKIKQFTNIYSELITTDLTLTEAISLAKYTINFQGELKNVILEQETKDKKGILINPPVEKYGRWVLVPKAKDFSDIHTLIKCNLQNTPCPQPN